MISFGGASTSCIIIIKLIFISCKHVAERNVKSRDVPKIKIIDEIGDLLSFGTSYTKNVLNSRLSIIDLLSITVYLSN